MLRAALAERSAARRQQRALRQEGNEPGTPFPPRPEGRGLHGTNKMMTIGLYGIAAVYWLYDIQQRGKALQKTEPGVHEESETDRADPRAGNGSRRAGSRQRDRGRRGRRRASQAAAGRTELRRPRAGAERAGRKTVRAMNRRSGLTRVLRVWLPGRPPRR